MKRKVFPTADVLLLLVGEIILSGLVILGYFLVDIIFATDFFSYRVFTGVLLGVAVTVLNYLFLILSVNRAVTKFLNLRGTHQMEEEEAVKFAQVNAASIRNAITLSFIIRTVTMLLALAVAFILDWFAPVATVIPLLAFRPILMVVGLIKRHSAPSFEFPAPNGADLDSIGATFTELETDEAAEGEDSEEKESDG